MSLPPSRNRRRVEARACIRILQALAHSDGDEGADELHAIGIVAAAAGVRASEAPRTRSLEEDLALVRGRRARRRTLRAANTIGTIKATSPRAQKLLAKVRAALDDGSGRASISPPATSALEAATVDFLHEVSRRSSDGTLTDSAYEGLVSELETRKRDALRRALLTQPPPK